MTVSLGTTPGHSQNTCAVFHVTCFDSGAWHNSFHNNMYHDQYLCLGMSRDFSDNIRKPGDHILTIFVGNNSWQKRLFKANISSVQLLRDLYRFSNNPTKQFNVWLWIKISVIYSISFVRTFFAEIGAMKWCEAGALTIYIYNLLGQNIHRENELFSFENLPNTFRKATSSFQFLPAHIHLHAYYFLIYMSYSCELSII